jgi:hypothetical protein
MKRTAPIAALFATLLLAFGSSRSAHAAAAPAPQPAADPSALPDAPLPQAYDPYSTDDFSKNEPATFRNTPRHFLKDQEAIWTSPARLRPHDAGWIIVLGLATTVAIASDHQAMSSVVSHDPQFNHRNVQASNVLTGAFVGVPAIMMLTGAVHPDSQVKESGLLSGEAMVDGLVVQEAMKLAFRRERPSVDNYKGKFFTTSATADSGFPSTHSVVAWASAAVLAGEYDTRLAQLAIYSVATGVSLTRVMGQQHFPSDALVGSATGWLIGHYVYRHHHHDRDQY